VYVAGKGKYCKETAVRGYLDCFYASLDACQKRNKSANTRCVPNPKFGTRNDLWAVMERARKQVPMSALCQKQTSAAS